MRSNKNNQKKGMVDVGAKDTTQRTAIASATVILNKDAYKELMGKGSPKGDVFETAKIAGIMAAKDTSRLIPMCHPLGLDKVHMEFFPNDKKCSIEIRSEVSCFARTGVVMESLSAVSIAALTIYDMMKWKDKAIVVEQVKLLYKAGGKSGEYIRKK